MSVAKFNVVDGVDGAGKSLQLRLVYDLLVALGLRTSFILTREPGGTTIAEEIRDVLLRPRGENEEQMTTTTENSLFWAARAQHVETLILPKLTKGVHVFSDRFYDVTYAYQGAGRGISPEVIDRYRELAIGDFKPDNIAIFDTDLSVLKARVDTRGHKNRLDGEGAEFYVKARDIFLSRAKHDPQRYSIIDAGFQPIHVLGQMAGWLERCGIISLNTPREHDRVVNAAMNVYWDEWNRLMEPIKRSMGDGSMSVDEKKERLNIMAAQGAVPSFLLIHTNLETGVPIYDFAGVAPQLLAGLAHFRSHRDPCQQRPDPVIHFNNEAVV